MKQKPNKSQPVKWKTGQIRAGKWLKPTSIRDQWQQTKPTRQKWARSLSVPKILTVLCLLGLGLNGLVQVGLQKDMAKKATQLRQNLAQAQSLSGNMKDSLQGLGDLRDSSQHMAQTLGQLQAATSDMNNGLSTLDQTVGGINQTVQTLGNSTQNTDKQIQLTRQSAQQLLSLLQKINQVNAGTIDDLGQMISDQQTINGNLATMNQKTQLLPQWEGQ